MYKINKLKTKRSPFMRSAIMILIIMMLTVSALGSAFADSSSTAADNSNSSSQADASSSATPTQPGSDQSGDSYNGTTPPTPPDGSTPQAPPDGNLPDGNGGGNPPSGAPSDGSTPPTLPDGSTPQAPPDGNGGGNPPSGGSGGSQSANITYQGATEFSTDTSTSGETYSSETSGEQALLVTGGTSTIDKATVTKSGDSNGDEADFYGTNAAILVNDGTLEITGSDITTNGEHANAVFATDKGVIKISDSTITTTSNCSGGIMVTGGGTLTADNLTVNTSGRSSAPIRSDRGGGTITVNGGTYESSGVGSPVVYSTADITVNDAKMTSTASEGVVVEGKNSVTLNGVELTADNNQLNSQSATYKAIFLYQSMSGDAEEGTANFTAKNSTINVLNGDTIYITNTTADVYLENNSITNESGDFLRIEAGAWGNEGSNGGTVTATLSNQKVEGNIIVDSISTLALSLENGSVLTGAIDQENQAKEVNLTLSEDSVLVLTEDTYVDSLTNAVSDNSNIYLNGHKLYVNGTETAANEGTYTDDQQDATAAETSDAVQDADTTESEDAAGSSAPYVAGGVAIAAIAVGAAAYFSKKRKNKSIPEPSNDDQQML
ncbi:MAG: hypothetical protein IKS99_03745 [Firmicutes bacterium]|nr:hypothetical protein [Bacillota bacterium]